MENRKKIMTKAELDEIFKSRNFYDTIKIENCKITDMNLSDCGEPWKRIVIEIEVV